VAARAEDAGAEHVVGVPALEARDAFLCPSLYIGFEHALETLGRRSARPRVEARARRHGMIGPVGAAVDLVHPEPRWRGLARRLPRRRAAQTLAPARVLVIESGSVDGSRAIAVAHGAECTQCRQQGFAAAVNHGIAISDSPYVALPTTTPCQSRDGSRKWPMRSSATPACRFAASRNAVHGRARRQRGGRGFDVRGRGRLHRGIASRTARASTSPASSSGRARAPRSTGAGCFTTSASSTSSSSCHGRTSTSICVRRSPVITACTCRPRSSPRPGPSSATGARPLERRNKAILALKGLPLPLLALYLALLPAREATRRAQHAEGCAATCAASRPMRARRRARLHAAGRCAGATGIRELWPTAHAGFAAVRASAALC